MAGLMTFHLLATNTLLSQWKKIAPSEAEARSYGLGTNTAKQLDTVVNAIVNQMSHPDAVELIAKEWGAFPSDLRMKLGWALNEAASGSGHRSNNKTKGIIRLNKMLNNAVLRQTDDRVTERDLRVRDGKVVSERRFVNPAAAGAERAHAAFVRPAHYAKMTPAEKRALNEQQAHERRAHERKANRIY